MEYVKRLLILTCISLAFIHGNIIGYEGDLKLDEMETHLKTIYTELTSRKQAMESPNFKAGNKASTLTICLMRFFNLNL